MSFDVLVIPSLFEKVPAEFKDNIKSAIRELKDPFPGEGKNKKEIKGAVDSAYRLRIGSYRIFYRMIKIKRRFTCLISLLPSRRIKSTVAYEDKGSFLGNNLF